MSSLSTPCRHKRTGTCTSIHVQYIHVQVRIALHVHVVTLYTLEAQQLLATILGVFFRQMCTETFCILNCMYAYYMYVHVYRQVRTSASSHPVADCPNVLVPLIVEVCIHENTASCSNSSPIEGSPSCASCTTCCPEVLQC